MAIYLGLLKGPPSYLGSLQASEENIQHFKHENNYSIFVGNFCLLDPDPRELKLMRIRVRNPGFAGSRISFLRVILMVWYRTYQFINFHAPRILVPIPAFELHDETRVVDPDPDWIRIQSGLWIRIQEGKNDPQKFHVLKCWMASFEN